MGPSRANWVPPGAWLAPGYAEWPAPAALRGAVACLWTSLVPEDGASALVLPDACSDLIWEQDAGAYLAGPDTGPVRARMRPGTVLVGVRFRPGAGGQVLGLPLSDLRDQRVPLADLLGAAAARGLPATLPAPEAAARVLAMAGTLVAGSTTDAAIGAAVALLRDPAARTEDVAARVGLSERQFRRRSHAAIGYGPKTLQRVLRFQRFVRMIDAAAEPVDLAGAAARLGYADQPHLTRDCAAFSGLAPAQLARARRRQAPLPGHHVGAQRGVAGAGRPDVAGPVLRHRGPGPYAWFGACSRGSRALLPRPKRWEILSVGGSRRPRGP
jgi:AraC-like DNA-binding protein